MNKATDYKIEVLNGGKLFCVSDDYNMYGSYYKTRKGAEKQLDKVLKIYPHLTKLKKSKKS